MRWRVQVSYVAAFLKICYFNGKKSWQYLTIVMPRNSSWFKGQNPFKYQSYDLPGKIDNLYDLEC